jgi:hypothetical protein
MKYIYIYLQYNNKKAFKCNKDVVKNYLPQTNWARSWGELFCIWSKYATGPAHDTQKKLAALHSWMPLNAEGNSMLLTWTRMPHHVTEALAITVRACSWRMFHVDWHVILALSAGIDRVSCKLMAPWTNLQQLHHLLLTFCHVWTM